MTASVDLDPRVSLPRSGDQAADLARIRQRLHQVSGELAELYHQLDELGRAIAEHQSGLRRSTV